MNMAWTQCPAMHCTHLYCPRLAPFVRTCAHKCQYPQIQTQNGHLSCSHVLSHEALGGPLEVHNCAAHSQFGCVGVPLRDALWIQGLECCTSFSHESAQRHSQTHRPSFVHWMCWLSSSQVQSAPHSCLHTPRSIGAHYCRNDLVLVCPSCESDLQMHTFSCILSLSRSRDTFFHGRCAPHACVHKGWYMGFCMLEESILLYLCVPRSCICDLQNDWFWVCIQFCSLMPSQTSSTPSCMCGFLASNHAPLHGNMYSQHLLIHIMVHHLRRRLTLILHFRVTTSGNMDNFY